MPEATLTHTHQHRTRGVSKPQPIRSHRNWQTNDDEEPPSSEDELDSIHQEKVIYVSQRTASLHTDHLSLRNRSTSPYTDSHGSPSSQSSSITSYEDDRDPCEIGSKTTESRKTYFWLRAKEISDHYAQLEKPPITIRSSSNKPIIESDPELGFIKHSDTTAELSSTSFYRAPINAGADKMELPVEALGRKIDVSPKRKIGPRMAASPGRSRGDTLLMRIGDSPDVENDVLGYEETLVNERMRSPGQGWEDDPQTPQRRFSWVPSDRETTSKTSSHSTTSSPIFQESQLSIQRHSEHTSKESSGLLILGSKNPGLLHKMDLDDSIDMISVEELLLEPSLDFPTRGSSISKIL
ncbi:hypothetical protein BC829DRAFT_388135 [Chytridium lagenaria]|nr:hypothetical protein BC829DRAFT_388135 [Chytridium lagenaria]